MGSERLKTLPTLTQLEFKPSCVADVTRKSRLLPHRSLEPLSVIVGPEAGHKVQLLC